MPDKNYADLREEKSERMTYHAIIAAKQLYLKTIIIGIQVTIKIYLILLSFHDRFLNFNAKSGISATKRKQNNNMKRKRNIALNR